VSYFDQHVLPAWFGPSLGADDKRALNFVSQLCDRAGLRPSGLEDLQLFDAASTQNLVNSFPRDVLGDAFGDVDEAINAFLSRSALWRGSNFVLAKGRELYFYWIQDGKIEPEVGAYVLSFEPLIVISHFMAVLVLTETGEIVVLVQGDDGWGDMMLDDPP
jgi:hypothetical protein